MQHVIPWAIDLAGVLRPERAKDPNAVSVIYLKMNLEMQEIREPSLANPHKHSHKFRASLPLYCTLIKLFNNHGVLAASKSLIYRIC